MQNCIKCGASWNSDKKYEKCPFCGAGLVIKKTADSIDDAFSLIVEKYGREVFLSGNRLIGLMGDYAPSLVNERKLIKAAIEVGAYKAIYEAPEKERPQILNKYVSLLTNNYYISEEWARRALMWCADNLSEMKTPNLPVKAGIVENLDGLKENSDRIGKPHNLSIDTDLIIKDGVLIKYIGNKSTLELPENIHTIGPGAFRSNSVLNKIILSESIKAINNNAFENCSNLEEIFFTKGLKEIGEYVFAHCIKLKNCELPDSVKTVGKYSFSGCFGLENIRLSDNMSEIQEGTFLECISLVSISFPQQLNIIRKKAFRQCGALETLTLPESTRLIESLAFSCCWKLKNVTITLNIANIISSGDIRLDRLCWR